MEHDQQPARVGIRWTIGDVSQAGFEALQLSIRGMWRIFGAGAEYAVCVNTIPTARAIDRTGELPASVEWLRADDLIPAWLQQRVDSEMAEGVAWKFAPVRVFPGLHEISLDNDVICWALPFALERWLQTRDAKSCVLAADLRPALGQFAETCKHQPLNSGIRGLPPEFPMEDKLRETLGRSGVTLKSELDEQGLQVAALQDANLFIVDTDDVSICSPFPNHSQQFGRAGAHFIGVNPRHLPWTLQGRFAHEVIQEFWILRKAQMAALLVGNGALSPYRPDSAQPIENVEGRTGWGLPAAPKRTFDRVRSAILLRGIAGLLKRELPPAFSRLCGCSRCRLGPPLRRGALPRRF